MGVGYCECGCGQETSISKRNQRGIRKGEPMRYIASHSGRSRTKLAMPVDVRFWTHVDKTSTCWLWTGAKFGSGHGSFTIGSRTTGVKTMGAHVFSYTLVNGAVPVGLELDHLCRVRNCVRPDHLEPVTQYENMMRGQAPAAINKRKTECPRRHEYNDENTRWRPRGNGRYYRCCAQCERDRSRRRRTIRKAAA